MLAQSVNAFILCRLEDLGARSAGDAGLGGRLDSPALGRLSKQKVAGRVEKTHRAGLLVNPHFHTRRCQSECLVVFLPRPVCGRRTGDDGEALERRRLGGTGVGDANNLFRPELDAERAAINGELRSIGQLL